MKHFRLSRLGEDGEYEAILRIMHIYVYRCEECTSCHMCEHLCHVNLYFEILDGSPDADAPANWLRCSSFPEWPDPDSVLERMMKMVEDPMPWIQPGVPRISTSLVGYRFRVRVKQTWGASVGDFVDHESVVADVLGLAEPATETKLKRA